MKGIKVISNFEEKLIDYCIEKKQIIYFFAITMLFIVIRLSLFNFKSGDYLFYLKPWYKTIKNLGGFPALKKQVGDYSVPYQFVIALFSNLHFKDLYLYKVVSTIFDFVLGICSSKLISIIDKRINFLLPYSLVLLLPTVIFNSAMWAQADSIYVSFIVISLLLFYSKHYVPSFIFFGIALAFKLQTILLLPFFFLVYLVRKDFSFLFFLIIPVSVYICNIPGFIFGRSWLTPFLVYRHQTVEFKGLFFNLYNFSALLNNHGHAITWSDYLTLKKFLILFTLVILICGYFLILTRLKRIKFDGIYFLEVATWTFWTCIMFLPAMHERYGYFVDIMLVLIGITYKKIRKVALISIFGSFLGYTKFLLKIEYSTNILLIVTILVIMDYFYFTEIVLFDDEKGEGQDSDYYETIL